MYSAKRRQDTLSGRAGHRDRLADAQTQKGPAPRLLLLLSERRLQSQQILQGRRYLLFWYCDIVEYDYDAAANTYVVTDLLADVIVYPDGFVKVVDIDELVTALNEKLISEDTLKKSLLSLSNLLEIIYSGNFHKLQTPIEQVLSS